MIRLTLVLVAAIYAAMVLWGRQPPDDIEVARSAPLDDTLLVAAADTSAAPAEPAAAAAEEHGGRDVSTDEAVRMALLAGEEPRARPGADEARVAAEPATAEPVWFVTGTRVNLRAGPSTQNRVVGQVTLGDTAEVLSDPGADWIRIRVTDTGTEAYIFGRFLSEDPA